MEANYSLTLLQRKKLFLHQLIQRKYEGPLKTPRKLPQCFVLQSFVPFPLFWPCFLSSCAFSSNFYFQLRQCLVLPKNHNWSFFLKMLISQNNFKMLVNKILFDTDKRNSGNLRVLRSRVGSTISRLLVRTLDHGAIGVSWELSQLSRIMRRAARLAKGTETKLLQKHTGTVQL